MKENAHVMDGVGAWVMDGAAKMSATVMLYSHRKRMQLLFNSALSPCTARPPKL